MTIPDTQLETWAHRGAMQASANTYAAVTRAIEASTALSTKRPEIYLQGSYRNATNVYGDSDVDVVVQLNQSTFYYDLGWLPEQEAQYFKETVPPATYQWTDFR